MKDSTLYKISLALSVLGVLGLFLFVSLSGHEKVEVGQIDQEYIGRRVEVEGMLGGKYTSEGGHFFFHVKNGEEKLDAVLFKNELEAMGMDPEDVEEGTEVTLVGDIETYEGNIQIRPVELTLK